MNNQIKPLTPELITDFLWFFDNRAFCDNPEWARCYCMFYQYKATLDDWMKRIGVENREEATNQIQSGQLRGYLAYDGATPVGYCNANAKKNLWFDKYRMETNNSGNDGIYSVVCFVIDPEYRRKGISKLFINHIIDTVDSSQFRHIEVYPSKNCSEEKHNYHGFLEMYQKLGFTVEMEFAKFCIMRFNLP
jgi:ribosomal protein S18 acetylase RimI-like enzyme